jgi:hypothetical protein
MLRMPALIGSRVAAPAALALTLGVVTASSALAATGQPAPAARNDARGLRLSLVAMLTLALGCGVVAQYQTGGTRRRGARRVDHLRLVQPETDEAAGVVRGAVPRNRPTGRADRDWPVTSTPPSFAGSHADHRTLGSGAPRVSAAGTSPRRQTWAEEQCARAVAAAFAYDRAATLSAFLNAVESDPAVRPTATPGYWEMPPGGHADLARAYLRSGRPLDARTVLTVALLTFPRDPELRALLDDAARWLEAPRQDHGLNGANTPRGRTERAR